MSRDIEVPIFADGRIESVTGHGEAGQEIMDKINEKSCRYVEKYNKEPKHVILDSHSYLDLYAYLIHYRNGFPLQSDINVLYTIAGELSPIVLPQTKKRIQVIGDDPMFTATQTISSQLRNGTRREI